MLSNEFVASMPKLGFGLMRLPQLENGEIDLPQTCTMVDKFLASGFKYFDTAWGYGDGASEIAAGKALVERHPRESFYLATKLPAWAAKSAEDARRMLETSLERTGAGYFDFYLLHNLGENRTDCFEEFGIWDFVKQKKEEGVLKHIGFSFHDSADKLEAILNAHPEVEFVQLQINYADWESATVQSRLCYETVRRHGLPVVIMEPVKGGNLADPPQAIKDRFAEICPEASPASWAVRFAASLDGVLTVLSGMSNEAQMNDNCSFMKGFEPLSAQEQAAIDYAREIFDSIPVIPCTRCEYCLKGCPQHVNIPGIFGAFNNYTRYNNLQLAKGNFSWEVYGRGFAPASACIECGACAKVCPQHIRIPEELKKCGALFEALEN